MESERLNKMMDLSDDWWRTYSTCEVLLGWFSRHVLGLVVSINVNGSVQQTIYSGFLITIGDQIFWFTSGHVLDEIKRAQTHPDVIVERMRWFDLCDIKGAESIPVHNYELDMFYLGTANAEGHPYIQYRGGSPGFLKVVDDTTLGFADFGGNQQYITLGNLSENPKAFIFLMDYVNSRRIKLWGTARVVNEDTGLLERLHDPDYPGRVERAILFGDVEGFI